MPESTFSHTVRLPEAAKSALARLEEIDTWRGIGPIDEVRDATHEDGRLTAFDWSARAAGRTWNGTAHRRESRPSEVVMDLDASEISGSIAVTVAEEGGDPTLTVELTARSKGVLAGMFWGPITDAIGRGFAAQVEEFVAGL